VQFSTTTQVIGGRALRLQPEGSPILSAPRRTPASGALVLQRLLLN